jgi:hypothetical protein
MKDYTRVMAPPGSARQFLQFLISTNRLKSRQTDTTPVLDAPLQEVYMSDAEASAFLQWLLVTEKVLGRPHLSPPDFQ